VMIHTMIVEVVKYSKLAECIFFEETGASTRHTLLDVKRIVCGGSIGFQIVYESYTLRRKVVKTVQSILSYTFF